MSRTRTSFLIELRGNPDDRFWKRLLADYRPLIEHAVRRAGATISDVDDLVQEVLIQLVKVHRQFDERRGGFRTWLRRITVNKVRDRHRRQSVRVSQLEEPAAVADEPLVEEQWVQQFRVQLVRCALNHARQSNRIRTWSCFEAHVLERRSAADVASEVGVSTNAVYVNSSRVMADVRKFCREHGEELLDVDAPLSL